MHLKNKIECEKIIIYCVISLDAAIRHNGGSLGSNILHSYFHATILQQIQKKQKHF